MRPPEIVATSPVTPIPARQAAPDVRVDAVDFNAYRLQSEWTFIQRFVQNPGAFPAASIQVVVSLLADGDVIVASAHAHIKPEMMKPGDRSPWLAQVRGAPDFQRVRVQVYSQPLTDFLQSTVTQDFRFEGIKIRPPASPFAPPTIAGEVIQCR